MRLFGHHISRQTLVLAGVEILLIVASLEFALIQLFQELDHQGALLGINLALALIMVLLMETIGLYDREAHAQVGSEGLDDILRIAAALLMTLAGIALIAPTLPFPLPTVETIGFATGLVFLVLALERLIYRRISRSNAFARRILVLGSGSRAMTLETASTHANAHNPYKILAFVAIETKEPGEVPANRVIRLEHGQSLLQLARSVKTEEIVVAIRERRNSLPIKDLLECKLQGITVTDISTFFEREHQRLQLDSMNSSWLVFGSGFRQSWFGNVVKRVFDLLLSLVLLLVAAPVMLLTIIAIKLEGPGPILYWQTRVGLGNKPFEICKFRSMRPDAEKDGQPRWAASDDDRITRVGRVIRTLRIDELPQIFNVLRGEMSFIGPRPERPIFVDQLSKQIPYFLARHSIRPGISGWAQVRYPYGASVQDAKEKLQYDLYYVKNHTLFLDILILLETVKVVLFGRGAR
ncbi:MAG: TIGR03013 family XrtA/PEP-CTERM system glycosyltransferase [Halochromatium sp.]|uniref:TIGR03013 family XrtA/PEP-CTERM system glycosyltransferase n=1 Tax=Halochromatium sp. TaxID=2049430 RepID=UPI00397B7742